jgi:ribosomal protein L23
MNNAVIAGVSSNTPQPSLKREKKAAFMSKKVMQNTSNNPKGSKRRAQWAKKGIKMESSRVSVTLQDDKRLREA